MNSMRSIFGWVGLAVAVATSFCACGTAQKPVAQSTQPPIVKPLSAEQQRKYDQFFLDAILEREKGHSDAAFDLLRHCLDINPYASEAHYFLAQYYNILDADSLSLTHFQRAAELNPDNETYMETLAQVYIREKDYKTAIGVVERLYDRNKDRQDLLEMLFSLYQQVKDYPNAISVLERIADGFFESFITSSRSDLKMTQKSYYRVSFA